jgi:myo-inositol 2-dehydrogenase/D-chiro-inositol 1-dehydrogenase
MKTIRTGLLGVGRIGKIHLENMHYRFPEVEVSTVADPTVEGRDFARAMGIENVTGNAEDILSDADIEAVVICSPTDTHADYVVQAAKAGKAIFCEKPLDLSLARVREVLQVVEDCNVPLMVGFNRRFDPNFRKLHNMVLEGKVGTPQIVKITSRDPGPPPISYVRVSGGMFLDMTIHDFDMARFMANSEVVEVYAKSAVMVDPAIGEAGDVDTAVITLTFENGALGMIDNSRKAVYGYDQRVEVFGSEGMVTADNNYPDNHRYYGKEEVSGALPLHFFLERYTEAYMAELRAFIDALTDNAPLPVTGKDGLMSIAIGLAAKESAETGLPVQVAKILGSK